MTMTSTKRALAACSLALGLLLGLLAIAPGAALAGAYEDFFRAVEVDNDGGLRDLLARGMDPNTRDERGQHPLFLALRGQASRSVELLLKHPGTEVDAANAMGETPLMMAALRADLASMKALVARGAQINRAGWTPLHYAASSPSAAPVQWLLEQGAIVDARAPNGNTALMLAARYGSEESVDLLLARGADRKLRNELNDDAADAARRDGRDALAARLASGSR